MAETAGHHKMTKNAWVCTRPVCWWGKHTKGRAPNMAKRMANAVRAGHGTKGEGQQRA